MAKNEDRKSDIVLDGTGGWAELQGVLGSHSGVSV